MSHRGFSWRLDFWIFVPLEIDFFGPSPSPAAGGLVFGWSAVVGSLLSLDLLIDAPSASGIRQRVYAGAIAGGNGPAHHTGIKCRQTRRPRLVCEHKDLLGLTDHGLFGNVGQIKRKQPLIAFLAYRLQSRLFLEDE